VRTREECEGKGGTYCKLVGQAGGASCTQNSWPAGFNKHSRAENKAEQGQAASRKRSTGAEGNAGQGQQGRHASSSVQVWIEAASQRNQESHTRWGAASTMCGVVAACWQRRTARGNSKQIGAGNKKAGDDKCGLRGGKGGVHEEKREGRVGSNSLHSKCGQGQQFVGCVLCKDWPGGARQGALDQLR